MNPLSKLLLQSVLKLPTMSFHETAIATFVRFYAAGLGVKMRDDKAGNLLIEYKNAKNSGVTFAAHMDHPGFEVVSSRGRTATVALWGKVNPKTFAGSKVVVYTQEGAFCGKIEKGVLRTKHLGRFCFTLRAEGKVRAGDFGHYDLTAVKFSGDKIITRAADNLISVVAILDFFTRLVYKRAKVNVSALFTRAEESGFLGAFAAMESGLIPKKNPLIVLECSSAEAGGVAFGCGPVIRAGDLQSTYDPAIELWLHDIANSLLKKEKSFKFQRSLLQGGRCEACVYIAEGYKTSGVALPLGNYHNQGAKGYAAEYVSVKDYENLMLFLEAIAKNSICKGIMKKSITPLWNNYRSLKKKLSTNSPPL